MTDQRYLANPEVVCHREQNGARLFNTDSGAALATNAIGYLIWQALAQPLTPAQLIAFLVETCQEASAPQVSADVADFLQLLLRDGFIGEVLDEDLW